MKNMVRFLLNGKQIELDPASVPRLTLDWLRHEAGLTGTKESCREGDCGACMVLIGQSPFQFDEERPSSSISADSVEWLPVTSCLLAVEELDGKHMITIEGLAEQGPTKVMYTLHEENASQCGFCSPGVVIALTGKLLQGGTLDGETLKRALEGNLCRCTGYASIHRSAERLASELGDLPQDYKTRLEFLVAQGVIPETLAKTMDELPLPARSAPLPRQSSTPNAPILPLGGGTDWFVKHSEPEATPASQEETLDYMDKHERSRHIHRVSEGLVIGASVSIRDFFRSREVLNALPGIEAFEALVASPGIRSRATLAGNIANASPVADLTAMLLALDARVVLRDGQSGVERTLPLEDFFVAYKKTAAHPEEEIQEILLPRRERKAGRGPLFNFEKAAKRDRLDIAAVNTACYITLEDPSGLGGSGSPGTATRPLVGQLRISAGGVAPVPLLLRNPTKILQGQMLSTDLVVTAAEKALEEISPISDVRGSAEYRREALRRLILAHFIKLFPKYIDEEVLLK